MHGYDQLLTAHYIWIFIGLVFVLIEYSTSRYFFIFLAIGTVFTSLASILFHPELIVQLIIFFTCSLLCLIFLRPRAKSWMYKRSYFGQMKNYIPPGITAIAYTDIKPGEVGEVKIHNDIREATSKDEIKKGDVVRLTKTDMQILEIKFLDRF